MPGGRTGVQLAQEARALRPTIKVLLTSGYTGEALARHQPKALPLIEKPFREGELAKKLREVLEEPIDSATRALASPMLADPASNAIANGGAA